MDSVSCSFGTHSNVAGAHIGEMCYNPPGGCGGWLEELLNTQHKAEGLDIVAENQRHEQRTDGVTQKPGRCSLSKVL